MAVQVLPGRLRLHTSGAPSLLQWSRKLPAPSSRPLPPRPRSVTMVAHVDYNTAHHAATTIVDWAHSAAFMLADISADTVSSTADAATAVATAAASVAAPAADAVAEAKGGGWFDGLANILESFLKILEKGLVTVNVPYAYGFSIILLTLLVKVATFPLTKQQVESTMAMQNLAPKIKAIQAKYAGDQERIQLETARVYKTAGVNPLAGCLPTLATIPVFIGLYQALSNVAKEGELTEGFFWIPSLAGPTSIAERDAGGGINWLFPFVDGAPPLGWAQTAAYLVLPVLLVASQYASMKIMQPPQTDDPAQKQTQAILQFLPLMIGWFSLSVPSGLSLYWFANNLISTAQMVYLRKMGGAQPVVSEGAVEIIDVGQARRTGVAAEVQGTSDIDKERAERFKKLKEAEAAKRAAKRAAEEAARQAEAKSAEERARLLAATGDAGTQQSEGEEEDEEEQDDGKADENNGAPAGATKSVGSAPRRSKRSRRVRKA